MGKTPPLLMVWSEVVFNMWSHAQEFVWVRLPLANGQERSGLQHLKSCVGVWFGMTFPLLLGWRELVCTICHALEFGWVRLPSC